MTKSNNNAVATIATQEKPVQDMTARELLSSRYLTEQAAKVLPKVFGPDRFMRCTLTAFNKNPKLLDCTPASIASVVLQCAQFGIEPDGRHAHIIPYKNEAQLQLDYKGLVTLVRRSGEVATIHADVVRKGDVFKVNLGRIVAHEVDYSTAAGEVYAVYATATLKDGSTQSVVLRKDEVDSIAARSRSVQAAKQYGKTTPWDTDWAEMAKKTAFRRLTKWLPLSYEAAEIVEKDQRREFAFEETKPSVASAVTERIKAAAVDIEENPSKETAQDGQEDY